MHSNLRILSSSVDEDIDENNTHDVVTFLSSIYQAKKFKMSRSDETNFELSFDVPTFDVYLLDQFTKMRFHRDLRNINYLVLTLPIELILLTKLDVAATLVGNFMSLRFNLAGQFITIRIELITSTVQNMKKLLDEVHNSHNDSAISLVCSHSFNERDTDSVKKQISANRVFKLLSCVNDKEAERKLHSFDKDLRLLQGVTCF